MTTLPSKKILLAVLTLLIGVDLSTAAVPEDAPTRATIVGEPKELIVHPATIRLAGPRALQQVVVTGKYADGSVRDLTNFCEFTSEVSGIVTIDKEGLIRPRKNGDAALVVKAGKRTARVLVVVQDLDQPHPVSFRHEVVPSLSVGGCNMGACHGTPSGKNGFRLSLRGSDPAADYVQLTRDVLARRTTSGDPDTSLILLKSLGRELHEGGIRFAPSSVAAQNLLAWIRDGLPDDPAASTTLQRLEILPGNQVVTAPGRWQQLAVQAHFSDGHVRDVTRLTVYSSSENTIAEVSNTGLVEFQQVGEVAILCRYLDQMKSVRLTYLEPKKDFVWAPPPERNYIDKHVNAKLKLLQIPPSDLCTDEEFIRRVYLDLCALLPSPDDVKNFVAEKDKDKRAKLVDSMLDRWEFAEFWALKWMDVLRGSRRTLGLKGVEIYRHWVKEQINKNTPVDQVVRELLTATGNTFTNAPANYFRVVRDPSEIAEATAQVFLGIRMGCARCHNHPFEQWTQDDYYSLTAWFARVRSRTEPGMKPNAKNPVAEIVSVEPKGEVTHPRTNKPAPPRFLGTATPPIPEDRDRREVLATWLTSGENPLFARSVVNRVWFHLHGRGIVEPVDDLRDSNPSVNDELLDALTRDFVAHKFDLKYLIRTIMNSRTYQLSAKTNPGNKTDNKYFSHVTTKLLSAEQLLDAICSVTEVPEDYKGYPPGTRAIQLLDDQDSNAFLRTFGRPARELACECERSSDANLAHALHLVHGATVTEKLQNPNNRIGRLLAKKTPDAELLQELFLAAFSRLPRDDEVKTAKDFLAKQEDKRKAWEDILWALLNSKEFMFRH